MRLVVKDIVVGYTRAILGPISFTAEPGCCYAFMGPNGIGKTTLLKTIVGILKPLRGTIKVDNNSISSTKREMFYVPETADIPLEIKIKDLMKFFFILYNIPRNRWSDIMESSLNLLELPSNEKIASLSHGQRRRLQLAIAYAIKAPITIIDDPLVGLDEYCALEIFPKIIKELKLSKCIVIITFRGRLNRNIMMQIDKVFDLRLFKPS